MKLYSMPRHSGKSTALVIISSKTKIPILCYKPSEIIYIAKQYKLKIPKPISFKNFCNLSSIKQDRILIDDAEIFLRQIVKTEIYAISVTNDDEFIDYFEAKK